MIACFIFSLACFMAACLQSSEFILRREGRPVKDVASTGAEPFIPLLVNYYFENALWHEPRRNDSGQSNVFNFYSHHIWWHLPTFSLSLKHPWGSYSNQEQCRFLPQSSRYLWASTLCGTSGIMYQQKFAKYKKGQVTFILCEAHFMFTPPPCTLQRSFCPSLLTFLIPFKATQCCNKIAL